MIFCLQTKANYHFKLLFKLTYDDAYEDFFIQLLFNQHVKKDFCDDDDDDDEDWERFMDSKYW
jgi:hypothetical protein